ncbi:hypothetical protein PENTCL1PPCAC_16794, partial [Pristionchus entomophagus]
FPQLKWREQGFNWYIFDGKGSQNIEQMWTIGTQVLLPIGFVLVFGPFVHMLVIVLRAGRRMQSRQRDKVHLRHAQTLVIQFLVLLLFLVIPLLISCIVSYRDNIYADTQTLMVVMESIFSCSSLANSYVVVARNRRDVAGLKSLYRRVVYGDDIVSASNSKLFAPRTS